MNSESLKKLFTLQSSFAVDAYDLFIIGIVEVILKNVGYHAGSIGPSILASATLCGAAIGQIIFGLAGDLIGRTKMILITFGLVVTFSILSSFSVPLAGSIYLTLTLLRFPLGVGIGGEYPLTASLAAEAEWPENISQRLVSVFSAQGVGNLLSPTVVILLLLTGLSENYVWRLALGFASIPVILTAYFRFNMEEGRKYKEVEVKKSTKEQVYTLFREYPKVLLGTAGSWFLFDISFYGNSIFNSTVLSIIGYGNGGSLSTAIGTLIIASLALPGYICSVIFITKISKYSLQLLGFIAMGILFLAVGLAYDELSTNYQTTFVILYGFTFFFSNFGPNVTTFLIPAEVYPTELRSTAHGISAASGKLGAILGSLVFKPMFEASPEWTFITCAIISFIGLGLTAFCVPDEEDGRTYKTEDDIDSYNEVDEL